MPPVRPAPPVMAVAVLDAITFHAVDVSVADEVSAFARVARTSYAVWKSTSASGAPDNSSLSPFLGDDVAVLAPSSGEEPASPRHRAGVASMAWRTTR